MINFDGHLLLCSSNAIIFSDWSWLPINFEVLNLLELNLKSQDSTRCYFGKEESLKN